MNLDRGFGHNMSKGREVEDFWGKILNYIASTPQLAVAFFFMWLCGRVLCFLFLQTNPKFKKQQNYTTSNFFHLAIGTMPGAVVIIMYHLTSTGRLNMSLEDLTNTALPASLILAGIICIILFWKAIRS